MTILLTDVVLCIEEELIARLIIHSHLLNLNYLRNFLLELNYDQFLLYSRCQFQLLRIFIRDMLIVSTDTFLYLTYTSVIIYITFTLLANLQIERTHARSMKRFYAEKNFIRPDVLRTNFLIEIFLLCTCQNRRWKYSISSRLADFY